MNKKLITALIIVATATTVIAPSLQATADNESFQQAKIVQNLEVNEAIAPIPSNIKSTNTTPFSIAHTLESDSLQISMASTGHFSLKSKKNNKLHKLLFGNTNLEAIKVGSKESLLTYGMRDGKFDSTSKVGNTLVSKSTKNGIEITRTLSLVKGVGSNKLDTVKMNYSLKNITSSTQNVSYKVMLDTLLDTNDRAPFGLPGYGQFSKGKNLKGDAIPNYWFAYDKLDNPTVVAKGTLSGTKPSRITFGNWHTFNCLSADWDALAPEDRENGDSCVVMDWNNMSIAPNSTKSFSTQYGINQLTDTISTSLTASILGGETVQFIENEDETFNPYETSAIIKNNNQIVAKNTKVKVVIPNQFKNILSLADPSKAEISLGDLATGIEKMQDYKFNIAKIPTHTNTYFELHVSADGMDTQVVKQNINLKTRDFILDAKLLNPNPIEVKPNKENKYAPFAVKANSKNLSVLETNTFKNLKATLEIPEEFKNILKLDKSTPAEIAIGDLKINEAKDSLWKLQATDSFEDRTAYVNIKYTNEQGVEVVLKQNIKIKGQTKPTPPKPVKPVKPVTPVKPDTGTTKPETLPATGKSDAKIPFGAAILALGTVILRKRK